MSKALRVIAAAREPGMSIVALTRDAQNAIESPRHDGVLKRDDDVLVVRAVAAGREVVVKRWRLTWWGRIKSMLGASRGWRHWRGAAMLRGAGIPTARVLMLARSDDAETVVMEAIDGDTLLRRIADGRAEAAMARHAGELVGRFAAAGLFNRDLKPSNVMIDGDGALRVIDCVAIHRRRGEAAAARMLASLFIEPWGCKSPPRATLCRVCVRACAASSGMSARRLWLLARRIVELHGDPTPKLNPLAKTEQ